MILREISQIDTNDTVQVLHFFYSTQEQKKEAVYCHVSQDPPGIYACGYAASEDFRGREMGVKAAEGFVRMLGNGKRWMETVLGI